MESHFPEFSKQFSFPLLAHDREIGISVAAFGCVKRYRMVKLWNVTT